MKKIIVIIICSMIASLGAKAQNTLQMKINHVAVNVQDLQRSTTFYKDVLGLKQIEEPFKLGKHSWFDLGSGIQLHVIAGATQPNKNTQNTHLCLSVSSFDGLLDLLSKNKIKHYNAIGKADEITTRVDGIKQLWIQDPDGFWIELNDAK